MHSAHGTIGVLAGPAALQACDLRRFAAADQPRRALHVLLIAGRTSHQSQRPLARFEEHLTSDQRLRCSRALATTTGELLEPEGLDYCDCAVLLPGSLETDGPALQQIRTYCRRGGALLGVRPAGDCPKNGPEIDKTIFGGDYQGNCGNRITDVRLVETAQDHPILVGVEPFDSHAALHRQANLAGDVTVLLTGECLGQMHPVAWTRASPSGRVFYTSLGHQDDFHRPSFLRLLGNAVLWACR